MKRTIAEFNEITGHAAGVLTHVSPILKIKHFQYIRQGPLQKIQL